MEDIVFKARGAWLDFAERLMRLTADKFLELDLTQPGAFCLGTIFNPSEEQCYICVEDVAVDSYIAKLTCSHIFHESCLLKWIKSGNAMANHCPKCRTIMDEGRQVTIHLVDTDVFNTYLNNRENYLTNIDNNCYI